MQAVPAEDLRNDDSPNLLQKDMRDSKTQDSSFVFSTPLNSISLRSSHEISQQLRAADYSPITVKKTCHLS